MTEPQHDATMQAIFNSLTIERGGVERLSALHIELCATIARLLAGISAAPADDVPRLADITSKLMAQLPPPTTPTDKPLALTRLSDAGCGGNIGPLGRRERERVGVSASHAR